MLVQVIVDGKAYMLRASQAVVFDDGTFVGSEPVPVAISYEAHGSILHADAEDTDWAKVCRDHRLNLSKVIRTHGT